MIKDRAILIDIQSSWAGVESLREQLQVRAFASMGSGIGLFPFRLSNTAHNVPFIFAFAVLNDVLNQLESEGHFICKSHFLGALLGKSKNALPWNNFTLIEKGKDLRNGLAHRGQLLERGDCWVYIDAIRTELTTWHII